MKTIADVLKAIQNGKSLVVTFKKGIEDKESYAETGMRARTMSATAPDQDGVAKILFNFEEFDAHNTPLESSNYYDHSKQGSPATLTAKQAGFYKPQEWLYFDLDEQVDDLMTIEPDQAIALFEAYTAEAPGCSYVQWLEKKVQDLQAR